jgi:hypothetical protein
LPKTFKNKIPDLILVVVGEIPSKEISSLIVKSNSSLESTGKHGADYWHMPCDLRSLRWIAAIDNQDVSLPKKLRSGKNDWRAYIEMWFQRSAHDEKIPE